MKRNRQFLLFIGDALIMVAAFLVMIVVRAKVNEVSLPLLQTLEAFAGVMIIWLITLFVFNFYEAKFINPNPRNIGLLAIATAVNIGLGSLLFYFFPQGGITPKLSLIFAGAASFVFLIIWRKAFYKIFTSLSVQSILIIGSGDDIDKFLGQIKRSPLIGRVIAVIESLDEHVVLNEIKNSGIPDIIVAQTHDTNSLARITRSIGASLMSLEEAYEELFAKIPTSLVSENLAMNILSQKTNFGYWILKNIVDRVIAILILIITSPFLLLAVLAIVIESGKPIIYSQLRTGKNMMPFRLYKLRSMVVLSPDGSAEQNGAVWSDKEDTRITFVGKIIRKLHIDEIPQMINILKGDISLVGPRPERPEFVINLEKDIPYYFLRQSVKPGFTGWAQIKFRYARTLEDSREKFEFDLYYLKNRGLAFDFGIIAKTIQIIFTH